MRKRRQVATKLLGPLCLLAVMIGLGAPALSRADDPPLVDLSSDPWFVGWSELLPPTYMGVDTDSADQCVAGRIQCVDRVATRLQQQVNDLGCDHNAVFSLAYARTTEKASPAAKVPWLAIRTPELSSSRASSRPVVGSW